MTYAASTEVPAERTRMEIERTLTRYGAQEFAYGWQGDRALIGFRIGTRQIRFILPLPDRAAPEFRLTSRGKPRCDSERERLWEQATRQRWRALLLVIKAHLEAVECGILTLEEAFLPQTVLPSGATVSQWLEPQMGRVLELREMPALLPGPEERPALVARLEGLEGKE